MVYRHTTLLGSLLATACYTLGHQTNEAKVISDYSTATNSQCLICWSFDSYVAYFRCASSRLACCPGLPIVVSLTRCADTYVVDLQSVKRSEVLSPFLSWWKITVTVLEDSPLGPPFCTGHRVIKALRSLYQWAYQGISHKGYFFWLVLHVIWTLTNSELSTKYWK